MRRDFALVFTGIVIGIIGMLFGTWTVVVAIACAIVMRWIYEIIPDRRHIQTINTDNEIRPIPPWEHT